MEEECIEMKIQQERCWLGILSQENHCGREVEIESR